MGAAPDDPRDQDDDGGEGRGGWWPDEEERPPPPVRKPKDRGEGHRRPRGLASPDRPKQSSRYSMFVGLAFFALIVVALLNLLKSDDGAGILGAGYGQRGMPLPAFAAPAALAGVDADANIAQDDCESSRNPCPDDQRRTPACEIDAEGAIRVCDLFDKPLAISFWFTRGGDCLPTQDAFDRVARRFGGRVNFLSMNVRDDAGSVADIVRDHGWKVPVGLDRDGAVSNLYRVGVCPTIVLAYPGGVLYDADIRAGNYTRSELSDLVAGLLGASRRRAEEVR
jgi:hypothetical protein